MEKVIAAIREWLREIGVKLKISDEELKALLYRSYEYIRGERPGYYGKVGGLRYAMERKQESEKWYYSQMKKALGELLPNKGTPEQFKELVQKFQRVGKYKQEELQWSGLLDWLDDYADNAEKTADGKAVITKADVVKYLQANNVDVKEVVKGAGVEGAGVGHFVVRDVRDGDIENVFTIHSEAEEYIRSKDHPEDYTIDAGMSYGAGDTKYEGYQLAGGENYRELLLTLPIEETLTDSEASIKNRFDDYSNKLAEKYGLNPLHNLAMYKTIKGMTDDEVNTYEALQDDWIRARDKAKGFTSRHFDEPNVLAHVRFNERIANGKKALFIEEVQSDWHQKGRREGYRNGDIDETNWQVRLDEVPLETIEKVRARGFTPRENGYRVYDENGKLIDTSYSPTKEIALANARNIMQRGTVPDAPFKNTQRRMDLTQLAGRQVSSRRQDMI
jgi:hypothetical protein